MKQFNVTGMSCAACSARVEKAVSQVPGVSACAVSLLTNSMGVEGTASDQAVIAAVEAAGYGAFVQRQGAARQARPDAGADALTLHGRTRAQQYAGKADWAAIGEVKRAVRIPVIANGDIVDGKSARACLEATGCDGLAVGRGALGNPWVFEEIKAALAGEAYTPPAYATVVETAMAQAREMAAWKGERSAVLEMRKHFGWYVSGRRGAAQLRTRINQAKSLDEVEAMLRELE